MKKEKDKWKKRITREYSDLEDYNRFIKVHLFEVVRILEDYINMSNNCF